MQRWVTIAIAGLLVAGCGGGDDDSGRRDDDRPTSTSTTSPPTTRSAESEVEDAYLAYWEMAERLLAAPDPTDPEITERAGGAVLGEFTDNLTTLRAQGQVVRRGPDYAHDVLSVELHGDNGVVVDCAVDDAAVVEVESGETVDERLVTVLLETTLRYDDRWLVAEVNQQDSWDGMTTCDR